MKPFWNDVRRKHLAESWRAIALGQLAVFGYQAQHFRVIPLFISIAAYGLIEALCVWVINGDSKEPER
jgi:hypothetical protein